MKTKIVHCTKEKPWDHVDRGVIMQHDDAFEVGERYNLGGSPVVRYKCPNCGFSFTVELPQ